jgi:CBS domain containing-hemolysin-like protein
MTSNPRAVDDATVLNHVSQTIVGLLAVVLLLVSPSVAHASFLSPDAEDALAKYLAIFVLFFVPVLLIILFWMVHVLPEKIAHKRHHPQLEAIRTLCLLSLVFGGLLWPIAWLWAYTKPVGYKLAFGTDKHPDYFKEHGLPEPENAATDLRERVSALERLGVPASELDAIRTDLAALESRLALSGARSEVG